MKKLFRLVLVSSLSLMCFSCYYDEIIVEEIPELPEGTEVSFKDDIEPIFTQDTNNCAACHNGSPQNPDLREGNAYNAIVPQYVIKGDAENSEFYQKLPGNNHPVPVGFTLSGDKIALIKGWIDQGAKNN
jgi:hypothetical protein